MPIAMPLEMHSLTVDDVKRIAADAAREQSSPLEVVGVTVGGDGSYAEVIIDIPGCRAGPCLFSVGIFRDAPPMSFTTRSLASSDGTSAMTADCRCTTVDGLSDVE